MGLKYSNMVKQVVGNTQLTLEAKTGESLLVKDIKIYNPSTNWLTIAIDKTTVGYFRIGSTMGNHLNFPANDQRDGLTLLQQLTMLGIFNGYPVAEGETLKLTGVHQSGSIAEVTYDVYDAGDYQPEMPNGSKSTEYMFVGYGDTGAAITAAGDALLDNALNPSEFPAFPFGTDVPAKTEITLHGVLAAEHGTGAAGPTDTLGTQYIKMIRERVTLFDDDKNGLLCYRDASAFTAAAIAGGQSLFGQASDVDPRPALIFANPLIFDAGEELNAYWTYAFAAGSPSIAVGYQEVGLIMTVKRQ